MSHLTSVCFSSFNLDPEKLESSHTKMKDNNLDPGMHHLEGGSYVDLVDFEY